MPDLFTLILSYTYHYRHFKPFCGRFALLLIHSYLKPINYLTPILRNYPYFNKLSVLILAW